MHARVLALVSPAVLSALVSLHPTSAAALPPDCGRLTIDDPLAGATLGAQQGGTIDGSGFTPGDPPGSIVWNLDSPLRAGCVELTVEGLLTTGVGEHDLLELFTGPDGSFTDGAADHFLLLKIAGDVFPGYEGRLKVELGLEYDALEVGTWAEPLSWSPAESHTLAVRLDGTGLVEFYRDDVLLETVDYTKIAGGELAFASVRIPNDGEYQVDPALGGAVYRNVRVYDADPGGGDGTTGPGPTGGDPDTTGGGPGPGDETTTPGGSSGAAGTAGTAGSGATDASGPGSGLPPPGQQPSETGCGCSSAPRPGVAVMLLAMLLLPLRRRRRRRRRRPAV